jgi:hypothetical protein
MPSAWFRPLVHNAAPPSLHGVREGHAKGTLGACKGDIAKSRGGRGKLGR